METRPMSRCQGFTVMELLIVGAIVGVLAALAVPRLIRARRAANEAAAIASMRAIYAGQSVFSSSCGSGGYAQTLEDLSTPPPGRSVGFISPDLAVNGVQKSGYVLNMTSDAGALEILPAGSACNANTSATVSLYFAEAHPQAVGATGQPSFAISSLGAIYVDESGGIIPPGMAGASLWQSTAASGGGRAGGSSSQGQ